MDAKSLYDELIDYMSEKDVLVGTGSPDAQIVDVYDLDGDDS